MILTDAQLDQYVGNGGEYERLLHALIRAEAVACGLAPHTIDWDFRPHVRDGGKDILIRCGSLNYERKFIPEIPSVWSAKSGKDGLDATTFRKEIQSHPKVLEHLRSEGAYVWCALAAADNNTRDKLRQEAIAMSAELNFNSEQIIFCFRDTITDWLNKQIGVASMFFDIPRAW